MLMYSGHVLLPVCDWHVADESERVPTRKLILIAHINEVSPHPYPTDDACPPYRKEGCCKIDTNRDTYYCFLSFQDTVDRINLVVEEVTGAFRIKTVPKPNPFDPSIVPLTDKYGPPPYVYPKIDWDKIDWSTCSFDGPSDYYGDDDE